MTRGNRGVLRVSLCQRLWGTMAPSHTWGHGPAGLCGQAWWPPGDPHPEAHLGGFSQFLGEGAASLGSLASLVPLLG